MHGAWRIRQHPESGSGGYVQSSSQNRGDGNADVKATTCVGARVVKARSRKDSAPIFQFTPGLHCYNMWVVSAPRSLSEFRLRGP